MVNLYYDVFFRKGAASNRKLGLQIIGIKLDGYFLLLTLLSPCHSINNVCGRGRLLVWACSGWWGREVAGAQVVSVVGGGTLLVWACSCHFFPLNFLNLFLWSSPQNTASVDILKVFVMRLE